MASSPFKARSLQKIPRAQIMIVLIGLAFYSTAYFHNCPESLYPITLLITGSMPIFARRGTIYLFLPYLMQLYIAIVTVVRSQSDNGTII